MSHSDRSQWRWKAAGCWYITTRTHHHPPATSHPPSTPGTQPHTHLPPPSRGAAASWMQIKPRWKKKKAKKSTALVHHQTNVWCRSRKNAVYSFQEVIFMFLKEGDRASQHVHTERQLQDERTRDRRRKCPWLWLCRAPVRALCKLMWIYISLSLQPELPVFKDTVFGTCERAGRGLRESNHILIWMLNRRSDAYLAVIMTMHFY